MKSLITSTDRNSLEKIHLYFIKKKFNNVGIKDSGFNQKNSIYEKQTNSQPTSFLVVKD